MISGTFLRTEAMGMIIDNTDEAMLDQFSCSDYLAPWLQDAGAKRRLSSNARKNGFFYFRS